MTLISHIFKCLTILATVVILVASLKPAVSIGSLPNTDKFLHFAAYAVLASGARLGWPKIWGGWIFIGFAILGVGIEITQYLMNLGRTASFADIIANLLGLAFPLTLFHFVWTRHRH